MGAVAAATAPPYTLRHAGYGSPHCRGRPGRPDACDRSRPPRHPLHLDRAEGSAPIPSEDGALQRAHHGNLSAAGARRPHPCRRLPARMSDGRVHRNVTDRKAAPASELPLGLRGQGGDLGLPRRVPAARALSAHFAIHPGAAAQIGRRGDPKRFGPLWLRAWIVHAGRPIRYGTSPEDRRNNSANQRALSCRLRRRRQRRTPPTGDQAHGRCQYPAIAAGALPLRRPVRAHPDRQGPALSCGRFAGDFPDRAGLHPPFHAAFRGRAGFRHGRDVRKDGGDAGALRDALCRAMETKPAVGGFYTARDACCLRAMRRI